MVSVLVLLQVLLGLHATLGADALLGPSLGILGGFFGCLGFNGLRLRVASILAGPGFVWFLLIAG